MSNCFFGLLFFVVLKVRAIQFAIIMIKLQELNATSLLKCLQKFIIQKAPFESFPDEYQGVDMLI